MLLLFSFCRNYQEKVNNCDVKNCKKTNANNYDSAAYVNVKLLKKISFKKKKTYL